MLFTVIQNPEELAQLPASTEALELRLDLFPKIDLFFLQHFLSSTPYPILLTLRKRSEGGGFLDTINSQEKLLIELLSLAPPFLDVEWDIEPGCLKKIFSTAGKTQIILSYHNWQRTPADLASLYLSMAQYPAHTYKIAAFSNCATDAMRLLLFASTRPKVSAIPLGERGSFGRILAPIKGHGYNYSPLAPTAIPGQIFLKDLLSIYHYSKLSKKTKLFGLIGDPISHSLGHIYHNQLFREEQIDAVYVKIPVSSEELPIFIPLAKELGFLGLSVTAPLKEKILPYVDIFVPPADQIQAVNTLFFQNGIVYGANTDGIGALSALEVRSGSVCGKTMVILGAGGAAKAIAFEAKRRGATVVIINRTILKAKALAEDLESLWGGLSDIPLQYDILINSTSHPMPISADAILSGCLVMDIRYNLGDSPFYQIAKEKFCTIIRGEDMFFAQANAQRHFWKSMFTGLTNRNICSPSELSEIQVEKL